MSELTKIFLTSGLTIFGGVVVFVLGQLIAKFVIEPVYELKQVFAEVRLALIYYAQAIHTPVPGDEKRSDEAAAAIRRHAADLWAKVTSIPCYGCLSKLWFGFLPDFASCRKAVSQLIGLANSVHKEDRSRNQDRVDKIGRLLGFKEFEE
ncbi:MAG: hypothetical protein HY271_00120 [Deltaproteobacteria bacterium]|nr:hypothetical protein [Deltaproteobacteria bacterium]